MNQPMRHSSKFVSLLLATTLIWSGCEKKATAPSGPLVLAHVGSQVITADDLKNEAARLVASNQTVPEKSVLLQQLVSRASLVERAKLEKLDQDYETRRTMDGVLITKLREKEMEKKLASVEVSAEELQAAFKAEQASFTKSTKVRLAVLFQEMNAKMSDAKKAEIRQRMAEGLQKAQENKVLGGRGPAAGGFGNVAVDYSEDQVSRYRGGDIGWMEAGNFSYRLPKQVLEVGYGLEKDKMSDIIETDTGLYVVMKTDFRESAAPTFSEASEGLRRSLAAKKHRQIEESFLNETNRLVKTEMDLKALAATELPKSATSLPKPNADTPPPSLPGVPGSPSISIAK